MEDSTASQLADATTLASPNRTSSDDNEGSPLPILQVCLTPAIVFANVLILVAIKYSKQLHKLTLYLLGNLAVADCSLAFSIGLRFFLQDKFSGYGCLLCNFSAFVSSGSSLSSVLLISLQNLIAVKSYTLTCSAVSLRQAKLAIFITWSSWIILAGVSIITADIEKYHPDVVCMAGNMYYNKGFTSTFLIVIFLNLMAVIIVQICAIVAIQQRKRFLKSQLRAQIEPASTAVRLQNVKKAAKMTGIITTVLLANIICWGPALAGQFMRLLCPTCGVADSVLMTLMSLLLVNSIVKVFIYGAKSKEFRHALKKVLCRKPMCRAVGDSGNATPGQEAGVLGINNLVVPFQVPNPNT